MRLAACCPMLACLRAAALLALALASVAAQSIISYVPIAPYAANVTNGILWVVVEYPQWNGTFLNTVTLPAGALLPSLQHGCLSIAERPKAEVLPGRLLLALQAPAQPSLEV